MADLNPKESIGKYEALTSGSKNEEVSIQLKNFGLYYDLLIALNEAWSVNLQSIVSKTDEAVTKTDPGDQVHIDLVILLSRANKSIIDRVKSNFWAYTLKQKITLLDILAKWMLVWDDLTKVRELTEILQTPSLDSRVKEGSLTGDLDKIFQAIFKQVWNLDEVKAILIRQKWEIERLTNLLRGEKLKLEREVRRDIDNMPLPFWKYEQNAVFTFLYADYSIKGIEGNISKLFPLWPEAMKQKWIDIFNSISYRNSKAVTWTINKYIENVDPLTLDKLKKHFNVTTMEKVIEQFNQIFLVELIKIGEALVWELKKTWRKATIFWKEYEFESERQKDFVINSLILMVKWFAEDPESKGSILWYYLVEWEAINFFEILPTWLHKGIWWVLSTSIPLILWYAAYKTRVSPTIRWARRVVGRLSGQTESVEETAEITKKWSLLEKISKFYVSIGDIERAKQYRKWSLHFNKLLMLDVKTFNHVLWYELKSSPSVWIRWLRKFKPIRTWNSIELIRWTAWRVDADSTAAKILTKKDFISSEVGVEELTKAMEEFSQKMEKVRNYIRLHPNLSDAQEKELLEELDKAIKREFTWENTVSRARRTWSALKTSPFSTAIELIFGWNDWSKVDFEARMIEAINAHIDASTTIPWSDKPKLKIDADLKRFIDQVWNTLNPWEITEVNWEKKVDHSKGEIEKISTEADDYLKKYGKKSEYAQRKALLDEFKARAQAWIQSIVWGKKIDRWSAEWVWTKAEFKARLHIIVFGINPKAYTNVPFIDALNGADLVRDLKDRAEAYDHAMIEWPSSVKKWKLTTAIDEKIEVSKYPSLNARLKAMLWKMDDPVKMEEFETTIIKPIWELIWDVGTVREAKFKTEFELRLISLHLEVNLVSAVSELTWEVKAVKKSWARIVSLEWTIRSAVEDKIVEAIRTPGDPETMQRLEKIIDILPTTVNAINDIWDVATRDKIMEQLQKYIKSGDTVAINELKPNIGSLIEMQQEVASLKDKVAAWEIDIKIKAELAKPTVNFSAVKALKVMITEQKAIEAKSRERGPRLSIYDESGRLDPAVDSARNLIETRLALDGNEAKLNEFLQLNRVESLKDIKSVQAYIDAGLRIIWVPSLPEKGDLIKELDARKMSVNGKDIYYVGGKVEDVQKILEERAKDIAKPFEKIIEDLRFRWKIMEMVRRL